MNKELHAEPYNKNQKFYKERHHINGQTLIYLGTHSDYYYVRFSTVDGYLTKSLRTKELDKAKTRADVMAQHLLTTHAVGLLKRQTIASITEWFTQTRKYQRLSKDRQAFIVRIMRIISTYFKDKDYHSIRSADWDDYWNFRHHFYDDTAHHGKAIGDGRKYSVKTLRMERGSYQSVVNHAVSEGIVKRQVMMPQVPTEWTDTKKNQGRPDATFTPQQYRKFRDALNKYVDAADANWRSGEQGRYCARLVRAAVWTIRHSGSRVQECLVIKHKDLEERLIKDEDGNIAETFAIYIKSTKVMSPHARYAILNYSGYEHLKEFIAYKKESGIPFEPDDWGFPVYRSHSNRYPTNLLGDIVRNILKDINLYLIGDRTNPTRATLRMLRRFYIIRKIDQGVPVEKVAMAVGHTISTCERFYRSVQRERYEQELFTGSYYQVLGDDD